MAMDHDENDTSRAYQSRAGFVMWGGDPSPTNEPLPMRWISVALVIGVALAIGGWFALHR